MAHALIVIVAYSLIDFREHSQTLLLAPLGSVLFLIGTFWRRRQTALRQESNSPPDANNPCTALKPSTRVVERIAS